MVYSQDDEPITTDRPTQSVAASVVSPGNYLLEMGFVNEKFDDRITNLTFLNAHFRVGLLDGVELRITQNYVGRKRDGETKSGLSPLSVGTKIHVMSEEGWRPQMSVMGQVTLKSGGDDFKPDSSIPEIRLNFQNTLTERFSLGYNLGYRDAGFNDFFYTMVLGVTLRDGLSFFVEPYGFFGDEMDQLFNAGLIYLANPKMQFDLSFGSGLSETSSESFVAFGAAFGF